MKWSVLKKCNTSRNSFRLISTEIWNVPLTDRVKKQLEEYWSQKLKCENQFNIADLNNKCYVLSMFPYPSGDLHIGHVRSYTISDTIARFFRMNGKNVFQPMGWDAFGLPAENAAIERGIAPDEWTEKNITQMKIQLKKLFFTFDWQNEITTSSPQYYRWTQYLFLKMFDAGLVYQKEATVNWDPVDNTVLAEEQVDQEGRAWRSGAKVVKKVLKQWFIRTTKFSRELYDSLNERSLHNWIDIAAIQKNWIGKCNGFSFSLKVMNSNSVTDTNVLDIWVEDPLDVLNAEFVVMKPNSIVDILSKYQRDANGKLEFVAVNPFTDSSLPIYISEDVPYIYGQDSYIGLPSKSQFDFEFARKVGLRRITKEKTVLSRERICEIGQKLRIGGYPVSSKAKDWLISRQRYWGTPIPIVHCEKCGAVPVPYEQLPVKLSVLPKNYEVGKGLNHFLKTSSWKHTTCLKCGGPASRETDTMDTFVDSSWYYLRYFDVNNLQEPFSPIIADQIMPVDLYVGGIEHAAQHLYYARFVSYFLHSIGMLKEAEPFRSVLCQGMIKGKTYKTSSGKYLKPSEVKTAGEIATCKKTGEMLTVTWEKMSKSKYNGILPEKMLNKYGVDTTRLILLYDIAPWCHREWNEDQIKEVLNWQYRFWLTIKEFLKVRSNPLVGPQPIINLAEEEIKMRNCRNLAVRNVTYHYRETHQLGELIHELILFAKPLRAKMTTREVRKYSVEYERALAAFIIMLAPIIPHMAASMWCGFSAAPGRLTPESKEINRNADVLQQTWPKIDDDYKLPLSFLVNDELVYTTLISQDSLRKLTKEDAMKHLKENKNFEELIHQKPVLSSDIRVIENYGADVSIITKT